MKVYNDITHVNEPLLEDGQLYIYVVENYPQGYIKIGKSTNIQQRLKSLSGSNGGGNKLVKVAISNPTYLYTLERIAHDYFDKYRIKNTEWFKDITFEEAIEFIDSQFNSSSYNICNESRKMHYLKHKNKK